METREDNFEKSGTPQEKKVDAHADMDEIYATADKQRNNVNLTTDSGGGLALPEDRIEANLQDSQDWDKQQNRRGAGKMEEDDYPEF